MSPARDFARHLVAWLTVVVFLLQSGCAALETKPPATDWQDGMGRVAIVTVGQAPEIGFKGFARGKGEGGARGAGETFLSCMSGLGHGSCSGDVCGAVAILMLGVCGVAGAIGGLSGAVAAAPVDQARQSDQDMTALVQADDIQQTLWRWVATSAFAQGENLATPPPETVEQARRANDYTLLARDGVDTVLEVALTKAGTRGAGINAPVELYMEARVRLLRTADNSELFSADYEYRGGRLKLEEWSADQGKALLAGLETGYAALGSHICDSVFRLYPFPDRGAHPAGLLAAAFGLAPIRPETRGQLTGDVLIGRHFEWVSVDSVQPVLSWQVFPRPADLAKAPELADRVANVRYDLVIAREHNLAPAAVVYRRDGLGATSHAVQVALPPASRYFWTVRARFELNGRERVTEWATTDYRALDRLTAPNSSSYRFKTR